MNPQDKGTRRQIARERAVVFIDGNNFYRGMRKSNNLTPGIGFDYAAFARKLVGAREWVETRYYVGKVRQVGNLSLYKNQRKFLAHLHNSPRMQVFLGRLESHPAANKSEKKLRQLLHILQSRDDVILPQQVIHELGKIANTPDKIIWSEKAVDVLIATDIVSMAYESEYDVAYLISADGDFTPAVKKARALGRKVFAASPQKGHQLAQAVNTFIPLKRDFFQDCWL